MAFTEPLHVFSNTTSAGPAEVILWEGTAVAAIVDISASPNTDGEVNYGQDSLSITVVGAAAMGMKQGDLLSVRGRDARLAVSPVPDTEMSSMRCRWINK